MDMQVIGDANHLLKLGQRAKKAMNGIICTQARAIMPETILIEALDFSALGVGSKLKIGSDIVLEVTQIGKEDYRSIVCKIWGVSLLPYEGLFCKALSGGVIQKGDFVEII
jgi:MOSC domain-containing protein YiiM